MVVFISDNLAFDWQWINWYFRQFVGRNPFGFSGLRIGDLSSGMKMDAGVNCEWKKLYRKTNVSPDLVGDELAGHSYVFRYDKLGQMTGAYYAASSDLDPENYSYRTHMWDEALSYDSNGNILSINRKRGSDETGALLTSPMNMDQLAYSYLQHSNKLNKIIDFGQTEWIANESYSHFVGDYPDGNQYTYDTEGRIIVDFNKELTFEYNHLDLVSLASDGNQDVIFTWDATGQKLSKSINGGPTTYYCNLPKNLHSIKVAFVPNNILSAAKY